MILQTSFALWALWLLYWLISARHRADGAGSCGVAREGAGSRLVHLSFMLAVAILLSRNDLPFAFLRLRLWPHALGFDLLGLALEVAGLGFTVWARQVLGKNWSARITTAATQRLIVTGPYRLVRHPIYTGVLAALAGTAILLGAVRGSVAVALAMIAFSLKVRREETALRGRFGDAYLAYARSVPAILPHLF